jgi:O-antigen ligase
VASALAGLEKSSPDRFRMIAWLSGRLPWLLIALTPVIFAILTWEPGSLQSSVKAALRFYGTPVTAIECAVVGCSLISGFAPMALINRAPLWSRIALVLLICIGFGTAFFVAADKLSALVRSCAWLVHLLFGLSILHLANRNPKGNSIRFWKWVVAGLCAYVFLAALYFPRITDLSLARWTYFGLAVINIRQVGFYAAVGSAAALGLAVVQTNWRAFALSFASASLLMGLSVWSGTRGSIFAVWAAAALGAIWFRELRSGRAWITLFGSTLVGTAISLAYPAPNGLYGATRLLVSAQQQTMENVSSGRLSMWAGSLRSIFQRPLFGYGEGQFHSVVPQATEFNHPHNAVLQVLLQWGLVGALCFFALGALLLWRCKDALVKRDAENLPALLVGASLLIMSLYEGSLFHPYPIMMIAASVGLIIASGDARQSIDLQRPR